MTTMRLFHDVARLHSFSQAAMLHGITQSAASQRIGQLEKRLGIQLLDRSVRPLVLTDAGRLYMEGCEDLLARHQRLEQQMSVLAGKPRGLVKVAAIYSAGIDLLNRIRDGFEEVHEGIEVALFYQQPSDVYRRVADQECDLGIVSYPHHFRRLDVIPLRRETMVVVCNPEHPLAARQTLTPGELSGIEMICLERELPAGRHIRQYLRDHGCEPLITDSFDNIDTIKSALVATAQVAILPRRTVWREVNAGSLRAITLEPALQRPLGIVHRRRSLQGDQALIAPAKRFIDYLLAHAGEHVDLTAQLTTTDR